MLLAVNEMNVKRFIGSFNRYHRKMYPTVLMVLHIAFKHQAE